MRKTLFTLLIALVLTSLVLSACGAGATEEPAAPAEAPAEGATEVKKITTSMPYFSLAYFCP